MRIITCSLIALCMSAATFAQDDTLHLKDVVVTGTRNATTTRNLPFTVNVLDREKFTETQRTNILPTLSEQVPGLFITQRGMMGFGVSNGAAGGINLRGINSGTGQLLVLIDGHPQYQGIYGHSIADSYTTMMAERVEILRGPASVLYGSNAMGGVINIITRGMKQDGTRTHINLGAGSWGTVQAEASNMFRKGKFSSTIAGQYNRTDNHRPNMGFEQYGGYAKLAYDFSDKWNIFANLDLIHFNATNPTRAEVKNKELLVGELLENEQSITRGVATLALENHYRKSNGRISFYYNWGHHDINDGYGPTYHNNKPQTTLFGSDDALIGFSVYESTSLFKGNTITLGFDYQHISSHAYYTDRKTGEIQHPAKTSVNKVADEYAFYLDAKQEVTSWLSLDAGVRYDFRWPKGEVWIPQGGIIIKPIKSGELRLTASKGFRNPTAKEMYLYGMANPELNAELMWNYEVAWSHRILDNKLQYGVNFFLLDADNLIQQVGSKLINTGKIINRGVEVEATWTINNHWSVNTNHSYLSMNTPMAGAPTYKGYIGANMKYGKWSANLGVQQLAGLYTITGTKDDCQYKENATLLNATVSYQLLKQISIWAKGENLLAQKYEINAGYPMPRATFMGGMNITF